MNRTSLYTEFVPVIIILKDISGQYKILAKNI
jgi:hypothetical protein